MSTQPGFPLTSIPAYAVPALASGAVAIGSAVTAVTLESTTASAQSNVPFTFGHAFKLGDLAPGDFLTGRTSSLADVPLQFNVKSTHADGSVRHAILSGILPTLAGNATRALSLVRVASNPAGASAEASSVLTDAGFTASLALAIGGVTYTASPTAALAAGMAPTSVWIGGAVATEWSMMLPLLDPSNNPHPLLTAQFNIRHYPGAACAKVDVTIENTKAYDATADVAYDATLTIGGAVAYAQSGITHYVATRFYKSAWWGAKPALHVKHDRAYLTATKQVPNYDLSVVVGESTLTGYVTQMADAAKFGPMGAGPYAPYMAGTGGRPDIGLQPAWAAATVISMDKRAKDLTLAGAACGGSWACHRRDTSAGPGKGYPLSVVNWPSSTWLGGAGDGWNYSTGQQEKFPNRPDTNPNVEDNAHTPNFSYLAYLLTGDIFYLEEIQFYTTWVEYFENCGYRQHDKGVLDVAPMGQIRGQGWALRALAEAAAITPDAHYLKAHFLYWANNTLAAHNARFTDNPSANKLGVNDTYKPYNSDKYGARTAIGMWQDDHFTSAVGHAAELGFTEAARLLRWKAKFQIGRLLDADWCFQDAAMYQITICTAEANATFNTWAEVKAGSIGTWSDGRGIFDAASAAAPCNSQQRLDAMNASRAMPSDPFRLGEITGYAYSTAGYPANLQPALAMAVDSGYTDGDLAWMLFDSRTVKPDYGTSPQFAILPRGVSTTAPQTPTPTTPQGHATMRLIDLQKQTATVSSAASITLGAVSGTFRTVAQAIAAGDVAAGATGVSFFVRDPASGAYEAGEYTIGSGGTTLTQTKRTGSSNNGNAVAFGGVACEVYSAAPAATMNSLLSSADGVDVSALATITPTTAHKAVIIDPSNGLAYTALVSALLALQAGTVVAPDTIAPAFGTGAALTSSSVTQVGFTLAWPAATDAVGVTRYDYSLDAGSTWTSAGTALSAVVTGRAAATTYACRLRAVDAAGNLSTSLSAAVTTAAASGSNSAPTMSGSLAVSSITSSGYTLGWSAATDVDNNLSGYDVSTDGGSTWSQLGNVLTFAVTTAAPGSTYNPRVRARDAAGLTSNVLTAPVTTSAAPAQTITVSNPGTQTANTSYTAAGTWTNVKPSTLQFRVTDNSGTPGAWSTPTNIVITDGGTWSFTATPTVASTSRTMTVQDPATAVSGTSTAYVVNAAVVAPTPVAFQFNGIKFGPALPATLAFAGSDAVAANSDFIIKTAGGVAPDDATMDLYAAMSTSATVMPRPNDAQHASATQSGPSFKSAGRIGAGQSAYDGCYAYGSLYTYKSFGGGLTNRYMWIMVFQKGADPATATPIFAAPYDGNHTGTPVVIAVTA